MGGGINLDARVDAIETALNGHTVGADVPADAEFTDTKALTSMTGILPVTHGGTGITSVDANNVLVGTASGGIGQRGIDTYPWEGSDKLITSGAVAESVRYLQNWFSSEYHRYSLDPHIVGRWINNKDIYESTFGFGSLPNTAAITRDHSISDIDTIIGFEAIAINSSDGTVLSLPNAVSAASNPTIAGINSSQISISVNKTSITITAGNNRSGWNAYVTIRYTKTT